MPHPETQFHGNGHCPSCDYGPFVRNHYFTGKLLLERDFTDEQQYFIDKLRHHHQRLHGWGVVCGLKVKAHSNPECRARYICIEPGTAIDCCGHEILVRDEDCIDITAQPEVAELLKKAADEPVIDHGAGPGAVSLTVCIRYRECPTEEIPVLYDDCGCDDNRCAPNRILESYSIEVHVGKAAPKEHDIPCDEIKWQHLKGCPHCDDPNCIVLATIDEYLPGKSHIQDKPPDGNDHSDAPQAGIDNRARKVLPSVETLLELIECVQKHGGPGGGVGPPGEKGDKGDKGDPGTDGKPGAGLEAGLVRIDALSWRHGEAATLVPILNGVTGGLVGLGVVLRFTDRVQIGTKPRELVLEILVRRRERIGEALDLACLCPIVARVEAVDPSIGPGGIIDGGTLTGAPAIAYAAILNVGAPQILQSAMQEQLLFRELFVRLRGDFVLDQSDPPRAVDANFPRADRPSGDHPAVGQPGSELGIQGGVFESWFTLG